MINQTMWPLVGLFMLNILSQVNIFFRFGTKLYRQVVGIPMGTNCALLVVDLFVFCYDVSF